MTSSYRIDRTNPEAVACCDRCMRRVQHKALIKQMAWRGDRLVWTGALVCSKHLDKPQPQDRSRKLPRDPVPIINPRPEQIPD